MWAALRRALSNRWVKSLIFVVVRAAYSTTAVLHTDVYWQKINLSTLLNHGWTSRDLAGLTSLRITCLFTADSASVAARTGSGPASPAEAASSEEAASGAGAETNFCWEWKRCAIFSYHVLHFVVICNSVFFHRIPVKNKKIVKTLGLRAVNKYIYNCLSIYLSVCHWGTLLYCGSTNNNQSA